jgi:uncharacterized membrane protein YhiD involved in acid resistance
MTATIRRACTTSLLMLGMFPVFSGGTLAQSVLPAAESATAQATIVKAKKSVFTEDGPVDTAWDAQFDSFKHALVRLPVAALLSAMLAFRPRRRGTPKRQAPVIQTQIILAIVGAMVMLVVGASLARAFGIVGAAGLVRYRAKVEDPKDAGVMLSTLAIGLASGVGLYVFAIFAAVFVLGVLLIIESIDPSPYLVFDLAISAKDSASLKGSIEGVLRRRQIPFELSSTSADAISYEVKLPLDTHTEDVSDALMSLNVPQPVNVKWEHKKETK